MFEKINEPLLPYSKLMLRLFYTISIGLVLIAMAEFAGMLGYHYFENLGWLDSFLNAAMILSGMGPLAHPQTDAGKLFAGLYALFSGLVFILLIGIIFSPLVHRFFHKMHIK